GRAAPDSGRNKNSDRAQVAACACDLCSGRYCRMQPGQSSPPGRDSLHWSQRFFCPILAAHDGEKETREEAMVCPVTRKRPRTVNPEETVPVGNPDEVQSLLEALASPVPAVRRDAARRMEISSLGALNAAETW